MKEQQEQTIRNSIVEIFSHNTNERGFRMDSNIAYTNINLAQVEEDLYKAFHIILSPLEKSGLGSVQDYIDHIIYRMREGGSSITNNI